MDKRLLSQDEKEHIRWTIVWNHRISLVYFYLYLFVLATYTTSSLISRDHLMFTSWFPFDWRETTGKFTIAFLYQFGCMMMELFANLLADIYPQIYINTLTGHIRALSMRITAIGYDIEKTQEENYMELVNCIRDQNNINEYFITIKPLISGTIFMQFLVTAFILCDTVVYVLFFDLRLIEQISPLAYLCAVIFEVLPCCIFVNEFMNATHHLTTAIFNCNWMNQSPKFKKAIIIFMQHTQKPNIILAANMIPVSLNTFLMIIKFSFSLFTILSQLKSY